MHIYYNNYDYKEINMRFTSGTLTHEFFLLPTIRYDDKWDRKYLEFDWLIFYFGVVKYCDIDWDYEE